MCMTLERLETFTRETVRRLTKVQRTVARIAYPQPIITTPYTGLRKPRTPGELFRRVISFMTCPPAGRGRCQMAKQGSLTHTPVVSAWERLARSSVTMSWDGRRNYTNARLCGIAGTTDRIPT